MAYEAATRDRLAAAIVANAVTALGLTIVLFPPAVATAGAIPARTGPYALLFGGCVGMLLAAGIMAQARATGRGMPRAGAALGLLACIATTAALVGLQGTIRHSGIAPMRHGLVAAIPALLCTLPALRPARRTETPPTTRGVSRRSLVALALAGFGVACSAMLGLYLQPRIGLGAGQAIGALRSLSAAQEQFKQQGIVDQDGDGMGEYGFLPELAGTAPARVTGLSTIASPFITRVLGECDARGVAQRSSYCYILYLPGATAPVTARNGAAGEAADAAAADAQETRWACYAWPVHPGDGRAFFTNHAGEVYASPMDAVKYAGPASPPPPDAAYATGQGANLSGAVGLAAAGRPANDGNTWTPVGN